MDRETLSNYGWITIVTLVLAVMLALATPFGTYVGDGVVSIARGYVATSEKKLNDDNVKEMGSKWDGKFENGVASGEGSDTTEIKREAGSVIPTGAKYTPSGKTALTGNGTNKFPDTPSSGDVYEEGDYIYTYNKTGGYGSEWSVKVNDKTKASYGKILSQISSKLVTNMYKTFFDCKLLTKAPTIPSSTTSLSGTFYDCTSLTTAPIIPNSVTNMSSAFTGCKLLTKAPVIPNSITDISGAFAGCISLTNAPDMSNANNVTNMWDTFDSCTSLTTAPIIPNSVTDMSATFYGCTSLTGTITINANPTTYDDCFNSTIKLIILTGSSSKLAEIAATAENGNVTVK